MIKKHTVVIASLLKPVDETRMFEKMALSMGQTNKYALNIIGFCSKNIPEVPGIRFHPLFNFGRLSWQRLLAPYRYWQKLLQVKPELIIVNTHDLLVVSIAHRILFGSRVIYDVQENYKQNIIWSSHLPRAFRYLIANGVRLKELLAKRMIVHFILAETCYMNECSFINKQGDSYTIIENKALRPQLNQLPRPAVQSAKDPLTLVYSGTIAETYGIFDCISLVEQLKEHYPALQLHIIGYCPQQDTLLKLEALIQHMPYIKLTGGPEPVPHAAILHALSQADYALIAYKLNPSNQDCFPTRIWECLAYKVPMIMRIEHPWRHLLGEYGAGMALDFHAPGKPALYQQSFYNKKPLPDSFYWDWEAQKLLRLLDSLF